MHIQHNNSDELKIKDYQEYDCLDFEIEAPSPAKPNYFSMCFKKDNVIKNYIYYLEPVKITN